MPRKDGSSEHPATGSDDRDKIRARKRLISPDCQINVRGQVISDLAGKVARTVLMIENGGTTSSQDGSTASRPGKVPIVKRRRQGDGEEVLDMEYTTEASSHEEDRHIQRELYFGTAAGLATLLQFVSSGSSFWNVRRRWYVL